MGKAVFTHCDVFVYLADFFWGDVSLFFFFAGVELKIAVNLRYFLKSQHFYEGNMSLD